MILRLAASWLFPIMQIIEARRHYLREAKRRSRARIGRRGW